MASRWVDPPKHEDTLAAAEALWFRSEHPGRVNRWVFSLVSSGFAGSITVKGRRAGSSDAFVAIPYLKLHLNGAAGDGSQGSAAITGTSLIQVDGTGMDVALDCTSYTSGSMAVSGTNAEG